MNESDIKIISGKRIRKLRLDANLTQKNLAEKLNLSDSMIGEIERGKKSANYQTLVALSEIFDVTVDYLLGRSEYKKGRILTKDEMGTFLPKELAELPDLLIAVDDQEQQLSEDTKKEIIEVLKKNGYIK